MIKNAINIGLGTAAIGRTHYINLRQESTEAFSMDSFKKNGIQVLDEAYTAGIRYFDTAPGYGLAEQLLMDWINENEYSDIEVATKWGYTYMANFNPDAKIHELKEHSLEKLNEQWEQSKKLLPYLTSYQIHSATFDSGVLKNKEVLGRLYELKTEFGLLLGLTTTGANQIDVLTESIQIEQGGQALFDIFQVTYNILDQSLFEILRELISQKKRVIIKEALANGRIFQTPNYPHYSQMYKLLNKLAAKYQVGTDAIALRFCMDRLEPFKVLSGASTQQHIKGNMKVIEFKLEAQELNTLKGCSISPQQYWSERKQLGWN